MFESSNLVRLSLLFEWRQSLLYKMSLSLLYEMRLSLLFEWRLSLLFEGSLTSVAHGSLVAWCPAVTGKGVPVLVTNSPILTWIRGTPTKTLDQIIHLFMKVVQQIEAHSLINCHDKCYSVLCIKFTVLGKFWIMLPVCNNTV